jgi:nucleotide-binding universal stress UspA family protein
LLTPNRISAVSDDNSALGPVVAGTDGSATAGKAVREAARLARAFGTELHLVYAFEPSSGARIQGAPAAAAAIWRQLPDSDVDTVLGSAAVSVRDDELVIKSHSAEGDAADALIKVADEVDAYLIVVGSRGMHGVKRVLGSVPNKVSHAAHRNVLIVATDDED